MLLQEIKHFAEFRLEFIFILLYLHWRGVGIGARRGSDTKNCIVRVGEEGFRNRPVGSGFRRDDIKRYGCINQQSAVEGGRGEVEGTRKERGTCEGEGIGGRRRRRRGSRNRVEEREGEERIREG